MRSESAIASSWSCVTKIKVMPTSRCSAFNSTCIWRRRFASSAERGSSSRGREAGSRVRGRAQCAAAGRRLAGRGRFRKLAHLDHAQGLRHAIRNLARRDVFRAQSICDIVKHVEMRKERVTLKTVLTGRRWGGISSSFSPPIQISPPSSCSKPASRRRRVVLPEPLSPRMVRNSPDETSSEISLSTGRVPKRFTTSRIESKIGGRMPTCRFQGSVQNGLRT